MILFAITPTGYVSESRRTMLNVLPNRSTQIDCVDPATGRLLERVVAPDLLTAVSAARIYERGHC